MRNQEILKPKEEKEKAELEKVEELRGLYMTVGSLEEMIDDNHCIISGSSGPDQYVNITSFVDKDQLELMLRPAAPQIILRRWHPGRLQQSNGSVMKVEGSVESYDIEARDADPGNKGGRRAAASTRALRRYWNQAASGVILTELHGKDAWQRQSPTRPPRRSCASSD